MLGAMMLDNQIRDEAKASKRKRSRGNDASRDAKKTAPDRPVSVRSASVEAVEPAAIQPACTEAVTKPVPESTIAEKTLVEKAVADKEVDTRMDEAEDEYLFPAGFFAENE
ncbi:hypothetical protein N7494_008391 [Penicillium frequentans]|uniref:Uncharacterized protein n=1 Tax=Penicillium frequentans TaxID=3151616 RepID=A0AAD6CVY7_9EURO|nr:hypothetical protein N7494_008391 [Penicillium glabrum]